LKDAIHHGDRGNLPDGKGGRGSQGILELKNEKEKGVQP